MGGTKKSDSRWNEIGRLCDVSCDRKLITVRGIANINYCKIHGVYVNKLSDIKL